MKMITEYQVWRALWKVPKTSVGVRKPVKHKEETEESVDAQEDSEEDEYDRIKNQTDYHEWSLKGETVRSREWNQEFYSKFVLFDYFPHLDMGDSSEWIWRSRGPRVAFAGESIPPRRYPLAQFQRGDVVMVNNNYSHYACEVQVVLEPLQNDGTRNLVARIDPQELTMFDAIHDGDVVVFIKR